MANLGQCLSALGQHDEALTVLRRSVAVNPDARRAWFHIASILARRAQYAEALQANDECLRLNEGDAAVWSIHGLILSEMGSSHAQLQSAADCFRRAIALDPNESLSATLLKQVETQLDTLGGESTR